MLDRSVERLYRPLRMMVGQSVLQDLWYKYLTLWVSDHSLAELGGHIAISSSSGNDEW